MRILLIGHGRMGQMIEGLASEAGHSIEACVDIDNAAALLSLGTLADIAIDFSSPAALPLVADHIRRTGTALLSGVTGYAAQDMETFRSLGAYAPVLHSANYSIGVAVLRRALSQMAPSLLGGFDVEIVEAHHNKKADAPSGTAKLLYEAIDPDHIYTPVYGREGILGARKANEIGIHALRGGSVAGTHTVSFFGPDEELTLTHRATSRVIFANGALQAAQALVAKPKGCYTLEQILFGGNT
ncbi:MAG: 4-hydroxy-tetrahydrodipicolinate reductase [Candidatus Pelethousia sp.]|nr:4-hydroxy-tetrahydrodipicolinate reductase [Candidatus Pelethousia sp.]